VGSASTRRPARTGGGVASSRPDTALRGRPVHPPAHGKASRHERRRSGGCWLCIGLHQARRRAAMHKVQHRFPMHDPRDTHRLALCRSTHERKGRHKEGRCHAGGQCALPGAEPEDTAAAIPGSPTRSQHIDSGMGPHDGSRQRAEQAATARAHHRSGHRHLAGHGHRLGGAHGKVGGVEAVLVVGVCGHKGRFRFLVVGVCGDRRPRLTWTLGRLLANILQKGTTATTRNLPGPHPDVFSYGP
jgi:hypothetical protein